MSTLDPFNPGRLIAGERLVRGTTAHAIWLDSGVHAMLGRKPKPGSGRDRYGSHGVEGTRVAFERSEAPPSLREAFEQERERCRRAAHALSDAMPSRRRRLRHRDSGDVVDLGRFLSDRPDCWERLERGRTIPSVTLGVNFCVSWSNTEAQFVQLAAKLSAISWALCESGYAVRILGCAITHDVSRRLMGRAFGTCFTLKEYQAPLDIDRILIWGMPGILRGWTFAQWESVVVNPYDGLGHCTDTSETQRAEMALDCDCWLEKTWSAGSDGGGALIERFRETGLA